MAINDEFWRVIATTSTVDGTLNFLIARMQSISNIDTRARLLDRRDFLSWMRVELAASGSLAFAISEPTLGLVWDEVQTDAYYAPAVRAQDIPLVTGATTSGGDTLVADAAPEGYTVVVYSFDGLTFTEVGPLTTNSQPGAGNYVLASVDDVNEDAGLPSRFLELTA